MDINLTKPANRYLRDDPAWHQYAYSIAATWNLSLRHIASKLGIIKATLDNHPETILAINQGWTDFQVRIMQEMMGFALAEPHDHEDPSERNLVRSLKLDAVKVLFKAEEKRFELNSLNERSDRTNDALRGLSDAELRKRALELLNKPAA